MAPIIPPIGGVGAAGAAGGIAPIQRPRPLTDPASAGAGGNDGGFGNVIGQALGDLQNTQRRADALGRQVATGDVNSVADYMVAATEANLATQFTVAFRNKAVESFQEIMRMQI